MTSVVLYRQYRPECFEDLIGQESVVTALQRSLASSRVAHAYLFSGPRGCGKTTSARIMARCLNCHQGVGPTPCGECDSCKDLSSQGHGSVDVIEMDAASHNGVDDARSLRERIEYLPSRDRYKIVILDEAHMITNSAFNALLKVVEEPPEHVKFIFATTEPEKVIKTIRSRTYHYRFNLVPVQTMCNYMKTILEKENIKTSNDVLEIVAKSGAGSVRDTLSNLDQLISSSQNGQIDESLAANLFGFTPTNLIDETLVCITENQFGDLFNKIEEVSNSGVEPQRFVLDLLEAFRDATLLSVTPLKEVKSNKSEIIKALNDQNTASLNIRAKMAQKLTINKISDISQLLISTASQMKGATSTKLLLELLVAHIASLFQNVSTPNVHNNSVKNTSNTQINNQTAQFAKPKPETVSQSTNQIDASNLLQSNQMPSTHTIGQVSQSSANASNLPQSNQMPSNSNSQKMPSNSARTTNTQSIEKVSEDQWRNLIAKVSTVKKSVAMFLDKSSRPLGIRGDLFGIGFETQTFVNTFNDKDYGKIVNQALFDVFAKKLTVRAVVNSASASQSGANTSAQASTQSGATTHASNSGAASSADAPVQATTQSASAPQAGANTSAQASTQSGATTHASNSGAASSADAPVQATTQSASVSQAGANTSAQTATQSAPQAGANTSAQAATQPGAASSANAPVPADVHDGDMQISDNDREIDAELDGLEYFKSIGADLK